MSYYVLPPPSSHLPYITGTRGSGRWRGAGDKVEVEDWREDMEGEGRRRRERCTQRPPIPHAAREGTPIGHGATLHPRRVCTNPKTTVEAVAHGTYPLTPPTSLLPPLSSRLPPPSSFIPPCSSTLPSPSSLLPPPSCVHQRNTSERAGNVVPEGG